MTLSLHLGCGNIKKEGYINIDIDKNVNPDMVLDLTEPLPFENESVDDIICINTLEHIPNPVNLLRECHRVLKPKGKFRFRVPLANTFTSYCDMTHINFFTPQSFKERIYYGYKFSSKKIWVTLPLFHMIKFPYQFMYLNKFIEIFTGLEGEFYV